jgi:phosphohistidine phosphatase
MAKKLLIVRHAKSDWGEAGLKDFDRPLNARGKKNAPEMGQRLLRKGIKPDAIISSPALRAITTCKIISGELGLENKIVLEPKIYEATHQTLLNIINNFDNSHDLVALFGHNNGITDLAIYLSDADIFNIPTCGMVLIEFPFDDWKLISKSTGELLFFDTPKNP